MLLLPPLPPLTLLFWVNMLLLLSQVLKQLVLSPTILDVVCASLTIPILLSSPRLLLPCMKKSPLLPRLKLSALLRSADGFAARTRTLKKLVLPNSSVLKVSQILETPTQVSLLVLLRSPSIGQPSSPNAHIKKTTVPLLVRRPTEPPPSPSLKRDISNLLRSSLTLLSL